MKFLKRIKLFLELPELILELEERLEKIEKNLEKAYIFTDLPVVDYAPPVVYDDCPDGCVFMNDITSTNGARYCMKCGKQEEINWGPN